MTLAVFGILVTAAVYIPAFFFGATNIDWTIEEPTNLITAFSTIADCIGIIWDLVTLAGLGALIGDAFRWVLVIVLGLVWTLIGIGLLRGATQA